MDDIAFDRALVRAAFDLAAETGWPRLRVAEAARHGGLDLARARLRFPGKLAVLMRFGRLADAAVLDAPPPEGSTHDRLFEALMRRFEVLNTHRAGVLALLRPGALDPLTLMMLARATRRSMGWMLEAAGLSAAGPAGKLRAAALSGVWLWTVRAWMHDDSADLAATMAALDKALARAGQWAEHLPCGGRQGPEGEPELPPEPEPPPAPEAGPSPAPGAAPTPAAAPVPAPVTLPKDASPHPDPTDPAAAADPAV